MKEIKKEISDNNGVIDSKKLTEIYHDLEEIEGEKYLRYCKNNNLTKSPETL